MAKDRLLEMKEITAKLNEAGKVYEQEDRETMSNLDYDRMYDRLLTLEKDTGTVLSNSPTVNVGYEIQGNLPKESHDSPMLSLDKTKDAENLKTWLGHQEGLLSWKLDGLTMVMTYMEGKLVKAVTRGNGQIGEVVTSNARVFENLPLSIPFQGRLVLRGEAVIPYSEFKRINNQIKDVESKYKNPRNLCSGTVRQLNNEITAGRKVHFFAFSLVEMDEQGSATRENEMKFLEEQGFSVVEYEKVTGENIEEAIGTFQRNVVKNDLPSDGLVLIFNDVEYGRSLGATAKFPRDSIAFKWEDEIAQTVLMEIEWSASRTGLINPIAIFEPVELEGTTVSRASVHNLSILEDLKLEVGDKIGVYKANMIIPQISENYSVAEKKAGLKISSMIPKNCPVCGAETEIEENSGVKTLCCPNPMCLAKQIKAFTHFVSRDAMNIEGLSEATIEKLIAKGVVKELADIFHVEKFKDIITEMEGFGERSFQNLVNSVEKSRTTTQVRFLYSLGISNIGLANAKNICRACNFQWEKIISLAEEDLVDINGIGEIMAKGFTDFFSDEKKRVTVEDVLKEVTFEEVKMSEESQLLQGKTFVVTGSVLEFSNRKELQAYIEERGGKATASVTARTDYLINNDSLSNSSKNKKAKELGVRIITEEEFLKLIENADWIW